MGRDYSQWDKAQIEEEIRKLEQALEKLEMPVKFVKDLQGTFTIPFYQRGYRWTRNEVTQLWEDVLSFMDKNDKEGKYCIQPLIVVEEEDGKFEVVDGQQRLTTIYIILSQLEGKPNFEIEYSRGTKLDDILKREEKDFASPDEYFISNARNVVKDLVKKLKVDKNKMIKTIKERVFFIYQNIQKQGQKDAAHNVFTNINAGKIPLTNAELIKALFLSRENIEKYYSTNEAENKQRWLQIQQETAREWNRIEQELEDENLWCFLSDPYAYKTRIDFLFEISARKISGNENKYKMFQGNENFSFLVFSNELTQKKRTISQIWQEVEEVFNIFKGYYMDDTFYNLIGFLTKLNSDNSDMFSVLISDGQKSKKIKQLKTKVWDLFVKEDKTKSVFVKDDKAKSIEAKNLEQLSYGQRITEHVLLLQNVQTYISWHERFPFDKYKNGSWNLEHINARNNKSAVNKGQQDPEKKNQISNLCILNEHINKEFHDKPFHEKAKVVREEINNGAFVPLCTQKVFLGFYSENQDDTNLDMEWGQKQQEKYLNEMKETIEKFFKEKA